ncbi:hypothetical protein SNE32_12720, partial [Lysobacter sp. D1-1-M9]|uniref:hypothetical protein n=1 Tax=Novilysobacter longmucuonensis TaxID=3098603 RepID=UPI002FC63F6B
MAAITGFRHTRWRWCNVRRWEGTGGQAMEGLIGLLVLVVLAVPVLLVVALAMIGGLRRRVTALEEQLARRHAAAHAQAPDAAMHEPTLAELMQAQRTAPQRPVAPEPRA